MSNRALAEMILTMKIYKFVLPLLLALCSNHLRVYAQSESLSFGHTVALENIINKEAGGEHSLRWLNVNTDPGTWWVDGELLKCTGKPIGVMRSEKIYENFILHVEWRHMEAGGNSGVFIWSDAKPDAKTRLPAGVEVQMLELDWVNQHLQDGRKPPIAYVHGELFGAGGTTTIPDNPRGERSKSIENRCKGKGEWNTYDVICVDGTVKLSVNGRFVNGVRNASSKKGYLCLESEGAEIHFRNFKIIELPPNADVPKPNL